MVHHVMPVINMVVQHKSIDIDKLYIGTIWVLEYQRKMLKKYRSRGKMRAYLTIIHQIQSKKEHPQTKTTLVLLRDY